MLPSRAKLFSVPVPLLTLAHVSMLVLAETLASLMPLHCSTALFIQHCTFHVPKFDFDLFYIFRMSFHPFEHIEKSYNNFLMFLFAISSMPFLNQFHLTYMSYFPAFCHA